MVQKGRFSSVRCSYQTYLKGSSTLGTVFAGHCKLGESLVWNSVVRSHIFWWNFIRNDTSVYIVQLLWMLNWLQRFQLLFSIRFRDISVVRVHAFFNLVKSLKPFALSNCLQVLLKTVLLKALGC
jgi:hypothetical protein